MVVRKILEATLVAGSTSVTFTDTDIPNSLLRVYCSRSALFPISQTLSGNSVTVNYKPQDSNIGVALEIVKSGLDIVDDLTTEDNTKALSANQGYVLKGLIDTTAGNLSDLATVVNNLDIPEKITDLDDVSVSSIQNGQVLAWNSTTEKFENVNQSGGSSSHDYSTTEQIIGTWVNGETLYEKQITFNTSFSTTVAGSINAGNSPDLSTIIPNIDRVFADSQHSYFEVNNVERSFIGFNYLNNSKVLSCYAQNSSSNVTCKVVIQYTKTS